MDLVTLIHGTFARHAAWYKVSSHFMQQFSQALAHDDVKIVPRTWGAGNRFRSRHFGAISLQRELCDDAPNFARTFIVAHSHGGNVALAAVQDERLRGTKIAAIGTPFISIEKRDVSIFPEMLLAALVPSWWFSLILALQHADKYIALPAFGEGFIGKAAQALMFIALLVLTFVLIMASVGIVMIIIDACLETLQNLKENKKDRAIIDEWKADGNRNDTLCIYTTFDEAYILLKTYCTFLNIYYLFLVVGLIFLFGLMFLPLFWDFKLGVINSVFGEIGRNLAVTPVPVSKWSRELQPSYLAVNAVFALSTVIVLYLAYAVYVALHLAFVLSDVSFGLADLPSALRSRIIVTRSPRNHSGTVMIKNIRLRLRPWTRLRLNHTFLTDDDEVVLTLAEWVKSEHQRKAFP